MKIYKFGGASLCSADRIRKVSESIADALKHERIVVVVSALKGVTDRLLDTANRASSGDAGYRALAAELEKLHLGIIDELFSSNPPRELSEEAQSELDELHDILHGIFLLRELSDRSSAMVQSFGERLSALIVSAWLNRSGISAARVDGRELIVTEAASLEARVDLALSKEKLWPVSRPKANFLW